MFFARLLASVAVLLASASSAAGAEVWRTTFDSGSNGVVQFLPLAPAGPTDVIAPPVAGELPVNLWHLNAFTPGVNYYWKAGRPLLAVGTYRDTTTSHSALYRFRWTALDDAGGTATVGFVSSEEVYPLRDALGMTMKTDLNIATGNIQIRLWAEAADIGGTGRLKTDFGYVDLGPNPLAGSYFIAIGYDAATRVQRVGLFDDTGAEIHGGSQVVPSGVTTRFDYLGWESGTLPFGGATNVLAQQWMLSELAYFDDADSAFNGLADAACCFANGSCQVLLETDCIAQGGQTLGAGTSCAAAVCTGACCKPDSTCLGSTTPAACSDAGGLWKGIGSDCISADCAYGACCDADQACADRTEAGCVGSLGQWSGAGTDCATTSCPAPATGACCQGDGSCADITDAACAAQGGEWLGAGTACAAVSCTGACCWPDGTCHETPGDDCTGSCDRWRGAGSTCAESFCTQPMGACCLWYGCRETSAADCEFLSGSWQGSGTACATAGCSGSPDWWASFESGVDGVTQFRSPPPSGQNMLGAAVGGELPVTIPMLGTRGAGNLFPKAGRQLVPQELYRDFKDLTSSHSALFRFRWTALYTGAKDSTPSGYSAWSSAGFVTSVSDWPLQGDVVALFENYKDPATSNYWLRLYAAAAGSTIKTTAASWVNLGSNPFAQNYQLIVSYDASTKIQFVGLYDAAGTLIRGVTQSLAGMSASFDYLGWQAYSLEAGGTENIVAQVWAVADLAYFDTANGALNAMLSPAAGACCGMDGSCQDNLRQGDCAAQDGLWQDAGSTCATASCSGACCLSNGFCSDNETAASCAALGGQWAGRLTTCLTTSCPLPPCHDPSADLDGDGDVDLADYSEFQRCYTAADDPGEQYDALRCHCFDRDHGGIGDGDVDPDDFAVFSGCLSSQGVAANPTCDDPLPRTKVVSTVVDFLDVVWSGYFSGGGVTTEADLQQMFSAVAASGITRMYWWATSIGEYHYPSQAGPMYNNDGRGIASQWLVSTIHSYDVVAAARNYATQYGLELYAWGAVLEDFYYGLHNNPGSPEAELYGEYPLANPLVLAKPQLTRLHRTQADTYLRAFFYGYPEVRRNKLTELQEMIDYGLDGMAYQTRTHTVLANPDEYGFNDLIVDEYLCRHGVDIRVQPFDKGQWLDVRGDYFTEFLGGARQKLRPTGKGLLCQVEVPRSMTIGAGVRTPIPSENVGDFKWDWQFWLANDVVDGVILQALGGGSDWHAQGWPAYVAGIKAQFPNAYIAVQYEFDNSYTIEEFQTILTDALSDPNVDEVVLYETLHLFDYLPNMLDVVQTVLNQVNPPSNP